MAKNQAEGPLRRRREREALAIGPLGDRVVDALVINGHHDLLASGRQFLVVVVSCGLNDVPPGFCVAGDVFGFFVEK